MESGQTIYRAYVCSAPGEYWIDSSVLTDIVSNGVPLVRLPSAVCVPLAGDWRETKAAAKVDAAAGIARQIGKVQAKLDALRAEILHDELTTEEVTSGVA